MKAENFAEMQNIHFYESIDSTNEAVKRLSADARDGFVVVADHQSAGRGRKGRQWVSPAGKNLYFSLLLKPDFSPDKASMLTLLMALAVKRAISGLCEDTTLQIKWPNDIVAGGKKLAGILTEMQLADGTIDYVIIGVGVNVKKQEFPQDTCAHATDVETAFGGEISRSELLAAIRTQFAEVYDCFQRTFDLSQVVEEYNKALVNADRPVRVLDPAGEFTGVAKGINEKGELIVRTKEGETIVYAGEVSVRGVYGYV